MKLAIPDLKHLQLGVQQFLPLLKECKIVLLNGEMGAGKTTFTQEVLKQMGISHPEGSPTYSIINEYFSDQYGKIYHLDLYRIKDVEELFDIGIEDLLDGDSYCFIEWPEKAIDLIRSDYIELHFSVDANQQREIEIQQKRPL